MTKDNKRGKHYTKEFKDSILKRLKVPTNETVTSVWEDTGVSRATIYKWIKENNQNQEGSLINLKSKSKWSSEDKFHIVLETASMSENELGEYCRNKGIYLEELKAWKTQCLSANIEILEDTSKFKELYLKEQAKSKELQKDLRRKEKALAETAALLVLRKKAQAIWGDSEEE